MMIYRYLIMYLVVTTHYVTVTDGWTDGGAAAYTAWCTLVAVPFVERRTRDRFLAVAPLQQGQLDLPSLHGRLVSSSRCK